MKTEGILYVTLAPGRCAEVRVSIVEEALPVPHEGCSFREPALSELEEVIEMLAANHPTTKPPFEIIRPTSHKPVPAEVPVVPPANPASRTCPPGDAFAFPPVSLDKIHPRKPRSFWSRIFS